MITFDPAMAARVKPVAQKHRCDWISLLTALMLRDIGLKYQNVLTGVDPKRFDAALADLGAPFIKYEEEKASMDPAEHEKAFAMDKAFTKAELKRSGLALAARMRRLWSRKHGNKWVGLKPGVLTTEKAILKKLISVAKDAPKVSYANVIAVCRAYVHSCAKDDYKYLSQAGYFVQKSGESKLVAYLSEGRYDPTDVSDAYEGDTASATTGEFIRSHY